MNDCIRVSNLVVHGHHGLLPEETRLGQKFYIDIECYLDVSDASSGDDFGKTVNYAKLCDFAVEVSASGPFSLIETLAERIATRVLEEFIRVQEVKVVVRKPSAPIPAPLDYVSVEVTRARWWSVALSLGSNMGEKASNIETALMHLSVSDGVRMGTRSSFYKTAPWGKTDQEWFVNAAALIETRLSPMQLLRLCKEIEYKLGRRPSERWGPRLIDIDILTYGDERITRPELTVPHKDVLNRAFVLKPLAEIAPELIIGGTEIKEALIKLGPATDEVVLLDADNAQ